MLVLSRHREEAIMVGDDVEIVVVDIRGDKVRLGVNAPSARRRPPQGDLRGDSPRESRRVERAWRAAATRRLRLRRREAPRPTARPSRRRPSRDRL